MDSKLITALDENNFDSLTFENSVPVLVFFSAKRCSVCKALLPLVEEIASEYKDSLKVYSVDVDEYTTLAQRCRLKGIPTLLIFNQGEIKDRISGFQPKNILTTAINKAVSFAKSQSS